MDVWYSGNCPQNPQPNRLNSRDTSGKLSMNKNDYDKIKEMPMEKGEKQIEKKEVMRELNNICSEL
jgi:hypothetical protein